MPTDAVYSAQEQRGKVAAATDHDKDKHNDHAEQEERKGVLRSPLQVRETKKHREAETPRLCNIGHEGNAKEDKHAVQ
jgi:hypothetical protein